MQEQPQYIFETNNFNKPFIWIKRIFAALLAVFFVYWIDLQEFEQGADILWLGYIYAGLMSVYIFLRPQDELALDHDQLHYIRKSLLPYFSSKKSYTIADMKAIKSSATVSQKTPVLGFMPNLYNKGRLEIFFKDKNFVRHGVTINKKSLDEVVSKVRSIMAQQHSGS